MSFDIATRANGVSPLTPTPTRPGRGGDGPVRQQGGRPADRNDQSPLSARRASRHRSGRAGE